MNTTLRIPIYNFACNWFHINIIFEIKVILNQITFKPFNYHKPSLFSNLLMHYFDIIIAKIFDIIFICVFFWLHLKSPSSVIWSHLMNPLPCSISEGSSITTEILLLFFIVPVYHIIILDLTPAHLQIKHLPTVITFNS